MNWASRAMPRCWPSCAIVDRVVDSGCSSYSVHYEYLSRGSYAYYSSSQIREAAIGYGAGICNGRA